MSSARAIDAIDGAIERCTSYIEEHATGKSRHGWGWCRDAARVVAALADARAAIVASERPDLPLEQPASGEVA